MEFLGGQATRQTPPALESPHANLAARQTFRAQKKEPGLPNKQRHGAGITRQPVRFHSGEIIEIGFTNLQFGGAEQI
jgi:hypothetical protein